LGKYGYVKNKVLHNIRSKTFKQLKKTEINSIKTPSTITLSEKCKVNAEGSVIHEK